MRIAAWLGVSPEVEKRSIATIRFGSRFDADWVQGLELWLRIMDDSGMVRRRVREAYRSGNAAALILDRQFVGSAAENP